MWDVDHVVDAKVCCYLLWNHVELFIANIGTTIIMLPWLQAREYVINIFN